MTPLRILSLASAALLIGVVSTPARAAAPAGMSADDGRPAADQRAYWSATNHQAKSAPGALATRRVVISGYHPAEGFEEETAAEQAALRRANANAASAPRPDPVD